MAKDKYTVSTVVDISGRLDYDENGFLLKEAYEKAGRKIEVIIKDGGDHHPHGLSDVSPIVDFLVKFDL